VLQRLTASSQIKLVNRKAADAAAAVAAAVAFRGYCCGCCWLLAVLEFQSGREVATSADCLFDYLSRI